MSNFKGDWHYAKNSAEGMPVVKDKAIMTVMDDVPENGKPSWVKIEAENGSPLELFVDREQTDFDISFSGGPEGKTQGRLVILSAATPAILIGTIHQPRLSGSDGEPRGPREDHNVDVFIAVKIC